MKLCIPEAIFKQHAVTLGKTGAGKSSALRVMVEHLLDNKKRVCILDPKGDWSGLKSSADGKSAGYPVIGFGDFKDPKATDVPINAQSGKMVAELIAEGNRPCIIGFRGWSIKNRTQFWIDFAEALYAAKNLGELYLVADEFHLFAPKGKIQDPQAGMSLHWSNILLGEGRGLGLVCFVATQRPQKLHNDVLTQCETLIAMKVIHNADRMAVKEWIDGCGDPAKGRAVLDSLAGLPRGTAYVWSPEINFGPEKVAFPMFKTFDSFAPPQLQRKVAETGWADVDLLAVRERMAAVIEEQKAKDPIELKRQLAAEKRRGNELQAQLENAHKNAPKAETKVEHVAALSDHERSRLTKLIQAFDKLYERCERGYNEIASAGEATNALKPEVLFFKQLLVPPAAKLLTTAPTVTIKFPPAMGKTIVSGDPFPSTPRKSSSLPKAEAKILGVLAHFPNGKERNAVAILAGYSSNGGGFKNALGSLRSQGYLQQGEPLVPTQEGLNAIGTVEPLPTGEKLFDYWMAHPELGQAEREILRVLIKLAAGSAASMTKEEIAPYTVSATGAPYEASGGGFKNALGKLRTLELIQGSGKISAAEVFFQ